MITDLSTLDENALIRLFDRTKYIQEIIKLELEALDGIQKISTIVDYSVLNRVTTGYICVLYRSLFQTAEWVIGSRWDKIDAEAFFGVTFNRWEASHNVVINYTDKVAAHQDASTPRRTVSKFDDSEIGEFHIVSEHLPNVIGKSLGLPEMIQIIQDKLQATYTVKTGNPINLIQYK